MKYLSFDLEATGLRENDLIIEFACIPFDTHSKELPLDLSFHTFVQCPSFKELKPTLDPWVIENNEVLINKAHQEGLSLDNFKDKFTDYLNSPEIKAYFSDKKITLFGKSMAAIDLPFLNRDLSWDYMRNFFEHRQLDLSSVAYNLIDLGLLPEKCTSGSELMKELGFGDVAHTALEDAINTAKMYLEIVNRFQNRP
jgi:DNA polymerase III epsilon subunit-like protein